jgi:DNA-binding transcriptional LysR family regulator
LNLRGIEIFSAVVRCRTTVAAAHELGLSQPTVSNAIKHLEATIGFLLFDRVGNRLIPTRNAESLYRDAKPLQLMAESFSRKISDLKDTKRGHLRIVSTHPLGNSLLPRAIDIFLSHRKNVQLFFDIDGMDGVIQAVVSGCADLGVAIAPDAHPALDVGTIVEGRMICALPRDHPLSKKNILRPADLVGSTIIGLDPTTRLGTLVEKAFYEVNAAYEPNIVVQKGVTACSLVKTGLGIAIVDEFSAADFAGGGLTARHFEPSIPVRGAAISLKAHPLPKLAKQFLSTLNRLPRPKT